MNKVFSIKVIIDVVQVSTKIFVIKLNKSEKNKTNIVIVNSLLIK